MELWNNELLPSIDKLIKSEISQVNDTISDLNAKFLKIEESQKYLSAKYDEFLHSLQSTKKLVADQDQRIADSIGKIEQIRNMTYDHNVAIDEIQQYQRRDCLEITGIPMLPMENTKAMVMELASAIGLKLTRKISLLRIDYLILRK
jgi:DNA repair ATPase RecN